ncbi:MAG: DNA polymerase III subunit beta [Firmicutes bacterium]|nr:DNA polymerase III subunit beta [Bacillota bacterium]
MRVAVDTARLRPALAALLSVSAHRETLPILSGVLCDAQEGALRLTAHNLSLGLEWTLPVSVDVPGQSVIPLRPLADLTRRLESGTLVIDSEAPASVELRWAQGEATLPTMAPDEFPRLPFAADEGVRVAGAEFRRGVEHVAFAAGYDPGQPVLEGVRVRFGPQSVEFLATDRSKVAMSSRPIEGGVAVESSVVFPASALVAMGRLSGQAETYAIAWDSHGVTVRWEGARLYSRLLDGAYPEIDHLIPEEYPVQAVAERTALLGACDRVAALVDPGMPQVYLAFQGEEIALHGEAVGSRAREAVPARRVGGEMEISFNARLLLEGLSHLEGDEVILELRGPEELMRMRPVDRRDQYVVVLPMMRG